MSDSTDYADRLVTLRDGPVVPVECYLAMLNFEARGLRLSVAEDGAFLIGPRDVLTDNDRALCRKYKGHFVMLMRYCADDHGRRFYSDDLKTPAVAPTRRAS